MLKIFPMGGIGRVTKNMFIYEIGDDMIAIDCGIGFAPEAMPGIDILVPDSRYLQERLAQGAKLHGIVLTHGHDDHIAALPYILREIKVEVPIYGSPLTAEFAMTRMQDQGIDQKVEYFDKGTLNLGPFEIETLHVTHSVPDTRHLVIRTPEGTFYHGSDFKIDLTPVDGVTSDLQRIAEIGREGVDCALLDCLRIERTAPTPSESVLRESLRREMHGVDGKVFVTLMSSNLHRVQQVIDIAAEYGRKIAFIGRSIEQNVNTAMNMGLLNFPPNTKTNKKNIDSVKDGELCLVVAGSQGQANSSMVRAVMGEHRQLSISKADKVIIASEAIPGNEVNVYQMIDELAEKGIEVAYSDVEDDLHVSGHAGEYEQMLMVHLLKPRFLFPIGGEERHRVRFQKVVQNHGYAPSQVVMPNYGKAVEFTQNNYRYGDFYELRERTVSVEGTSHEVVDSVLSEREILGEQGVVVVGVTQQNGQYNVENLAVEERGLGLATDEEREQLRKLLQDTVRQELANKKGAVKDIKRSLRQAVRNRIRQESDRDPYVMIVIQPVGTAVK